jgi:phosphoribosyl 1,2-cyclic phosphodiesterase
MPVYITAGTKSNSNMYIPEELIRDFQAQTEILAGDLNVTAFSKKHDAADPHSFIIKYNDIVVGVMTDIGAACENVKQHVAKCHALLLESNYDYDMLMNGRYPYPLKQRVSSDVGHLSNTQALEIVKENASGELQLLLLGHLSKDNNKEQIVRDTFSVFSDRMHVDIASRFNESRVFTLEKSDSGVQVRVTSGQLSIF